MTSYDALAARISRRIVEAQAREEAQIRAVVRAVFDELVIAGELDEIEPRRDTVPACAPTLPPPPDAA